MSKKKRNKKLCAFQDCGFPCVGLGLCQSHYGQHRRGKPLTEIKRQRQRQKGSDPIIEYRKVPCDIPGVKGHCHEWTRAKSGGERSGYGNLWLNGRSVKSHRYIWEKANGPIPSGLEIDHRCKNKACCNINHLRLVTHKVNCSPENRPMPIKTSCPKGHEYTTENTYYYKGKRACITCRKLAARRYYNKRIMSKLL